MLYVIAPSTDTANARAWHILDPFAANPVVGTVPSLPSGSFIFIGLSYTVNAVGDPVYLGPAQLNYLRAGKVFMTDLRKSSSHAERQLSSLTTACALSDQLEVSADGSDTWNTVDEAGPDGVCSTADDRVVMVRTTASPTAAPVFLPTGVRPYGRPLRKADMSMQWVLAIDSSTAVAPKLVLYTPDMLRAGDVGNGALPAGTTAGSGFVLSIGSDDPRGAGYAFTSANGANGALRRMTWDASGAAIAAASIYTFAPATYPQLGGVFEGADTYFAQGPRLFGFQGAGAPAVLATASTGGDLSGWWVTSTRLVFQSYTNAAFTLESVPRAGGASRVLIPASATQRFVGVGGEQVLYTVGAATDKLVDLHTLNADGSADTMIAARVGAVGVVRNAGAPLNSRSNYLTGALYCDASATASDCSGAALVQYDLASGARTTIGVLPTVSGVTDVRASTSSDNGRDGVAVISGLLNGVRVQDVLTFQVGVAGSLKRATSFLP